MKTELKPGIFIEGFDDIALWNQKICYLGQVSEKDIELLYSGKTSEISRELAKQIFDWGYDDLELHFESLDESIQSACDKKYCIIYKTN